jgi:hypothetical protein
MSRRFPLLVLVFSLLSIPGRSSADPVTLVASLRSISVSAGAGDTNTGTTSLFDQDVLSNTIGAIDSITGQSATASAFLSSFISAATGTFGGHGATSTSQTSTTVTAGAHAQASYFVTVDLDSARRFDFGARFVGAGGNATNASNWQAQLFFFPNGPNPLTAFDFTGTGSGVLSQSGILDAGRYGFFVNAGSDSTQTTAVGRTALDYTYSLRFSDPQSPAPVPEPSSLFLMGTGLAWAGRRMLKRRARDTRTA